jgi:3-oxoacyl-[acyl-carrier-protein] synthase III
LNNSIIIKETAIYHPEKVVNNEFYINHFEKQGKNIEEVKETLSLLGRENRYVADYEKETTLTMAIEASKRVLKKANLEGKDLDMIVFVSGTPEYLFPPNSIYIHRELEAKEECTVYDMNVACVGMTVAVEQVSRNMKSNPSVKRTLIVGAEQMHRFARKEDVKTYASFGDASCAVILERVEEEGAGLIDSIYLTRTAVADSVQLPSVGLSKVLDKEVSEDEKFFKWENVPEAQGYYMALKGIKILLEKHQINPDQIQLYAMSQLSKEGINIVVDNLKVSNEKFLFVGDEFGYTGTSSPFVVLNRAIEEGKVKRGDYIIFYSLGAGATSCSMLFKY